MNLHEFSKWLSAEITELTSPEPDLVICEDAADIIREARNIAQSLGYPDLIPPCTTRALALTTAHDILSRALATIDPPDSGPLTVKQVAKRFNVSTKTIYKMIEKGKSVTTGKAGGMRKAPKRGLKVNVIFQNQTLVARLGLGHASLVPEHNDVLPLHPSQQCLHNNLVPKTNDQSNCLSLAPILG